eukprot:44238-Pyramimonas_sp.AAC.1
MKVFSAMLKEGLLGAGVGERFLAPQPGFRTGRSAERAIFIARRRIDAASAQKEELAPRLLFMRRKLPT